MPEPPAGLPVHTFDSLLREVGLASKTMLKQHRREPGAEQKPVACYWSGHEYVKLYRSAEAVDMSPLSPGRQKRYDDNRTCAECTKKALDPWEKSLDGKRYCDACHEPAAERWWFAQRAADRSKVAEWAREILADPTTVLAAAVGAAMKRTVHVVDLADAVVFAADVRHGDNPIDPTHPFADELAGTVPTSDQAAALDGRRVVAWNGWTCPYRGGLNVGASGDLVGRWWSRWVGEPSSRNFRYDPRVTDQPPPDGTLADQVAVMRSRLEEMAGGAGA